VRQLDASTATAVCCDSCDWLGDDDDPCDGLVANGLVPCPKCGSGTVEYTYDVGEACAGCGVLMIDLPVRDVHGSYCGRPCMFQAEWARSLHA
jgi:hypothetical protein